MMMAMTTTRVTLMAAKAARQRRPYHQRCWMPLVACSSRLHSSAARWMRASATRSTMHLRRCWRERVYRWATYFLHLPPQRLRQLPRLRLPARLYLRPLLRLPPHPCLLSRLQAALGVDVDVADEGEGQASCMPHRKRSSHGAVVPGLSAPRRAV